MTVADGQPLRFIADRGLNYPISPTGRASMLDLFTEPSHRITANTCSIAFEADPDVVRRYVPQPLELDGSGLVFLMVVEGWVHTDRHATEFVSKERTQFTEALFFAACSLDGEPDSYCIYSWTDRDWLAYLGRHAGVPHKVAHKVSLTKPQTADSLDQLQEGVRVSVAVENFGLVLRGHVDVKARIEKSELPVPSRRVKEGFIGWRYLFDVCEGRAVRNDLVAHRPDPDQTQGAFWAGDASFSFHDAENEDVLPFQPRRVLGGWCSTFTIRHRNVPPVVVHTFDRPPHEVLG